MLIPPPPEPTSVTELDDKVDIDPAENGTLDANDESAVDNDLGSVAEGSVPTPPVPIPVDSSSDVPMDIDPKEEDLMPQDVDESFDPLDCIDRTPPPPPAKMSAPVAKMKELQIQSREATRRPKPSAGKEIVTSTLEAFNNQHEAPAAREKPPSKSNLVKPAAGNVKAEQKPDHVILNSQK